MHIPIAKLFRGHQCWPFVTLTLSSQMGQRGQGVSQHILFFHLSGIMCSMMVCFKNVCKLFESFQEFFMQKELSYFFSYMNNKYQIFGAVTEMDGVWKLNGIGICWKCTCAKQKKNSCLLTQALKLIFIFALYLITVLFWRTERFSGNPHIL